MGVAEGGGCVAILFAESEKDEKSKSQKVKKS